MNATLTLPDGRRLGYDDAGDPDGAPVIYAHGIPSARNDWRVWATDATLKSLGVRLIAVDRPGVGLSSFQPNRRLADWPADITALADALTLPRFSLLGYSGGAPYAAVCAAHLPDRVSACALVSPVAPFSVPHALDGITPNNAQFLSLSAEKPGMYRFIYQQMSLLGKFAPQQYLKRALAGFDTADRTVFARPEVHTALFAAIGSPRGQQVDTALVIQPWAFDLAAIRVPVHIWHGDQDRNASHAMAEYLATHIPNAQTHYLTGEGHISLIVNHTAEVLHTLTAVTAG